MAKIAALLIAAHSLGDFGFQPDWLVRRKKHWLFLFFHGLIHALLAWLLLQAWTCWQVPVLVLITHGLIDGIKLRLPDTTKWFVLDQATHVLILLLIATWLTQSAFLPGFTGRFYQPLVCLGGFLLVTRGAGFLIGKFARRLTVENKLELDGLENGGRWIGLFERALIFILIFIDQAAGIGFLVAAKSILRFEEAKQQKLAEYVLIGTLLSFSVAIALSWLTRWAMAL